MPIENMPKGYEAENKGCIPQETIITHVKLAHAYVPFQKYCTVLPPNMALARGTAFPELYFPRAKTM